MKQKKISTIIMTAIVVLSMITISNTAIGNYEVLDETLDDKTPGVDIFEGGNYDLAGEDNDVLKTETEELYYHSGKTIDIEVNDLNWTSVYHYLYYPVYTGNAHGEQYNIDWERYELNNLPIPYVNSNRHIFENIYLNYSGMWLIDDDDDHNFSTMESMDDTVPAWFWVNGSDVFDVDLSDNVLYYNELKDITINITNLQDESSISAKIDVRRNGETIFDGGDQWTLSGEYVFSSEEFDCAGEYEVFAYRDLDDTKIYYDEPPKYFDEGYGNNSDIDNYNYTLCGPWDPPEHISDFDEPEVIEVRTAKPNIELDFKTGVICWGFEEKIIVNVTDDNGNGLGNVDNIKVENKNGVVDFNNITDGDKPGDYIIEFEYGEDFWSTLGDEVNGTWYIHFVNDSNHDGIDEWNDSVSFIVRKTAENIYIDIIDITQGNIEDLKLDVPIFVSNNPLRPPVKIHFIIYGTTVGDEKSYYGDDDFEDKENITISGDILPYVYDKNNEMFLLEPPEIGNNTTTWKAWVLPSNPGEIKISIDWKNEGQNSVTIDIVNGTYIHTDIESFTVDEKTMLNVTVNSMNGIPQEYSEVALIWGGHSGNNGAPTLLDSVTGDGTTGNGKDGVYTFTIDEFYDDAPRHLFIAANTPGPEYWGYTSILMEANHDLVVECSENVIYLGDSTEVEINVTTLDGNDNPEGIIIEIYDEDENIVETYNGNNIIDVFSDLSVGVYHIFARNNTHDSKGQNATFEILPYTVTCNPSVLAWKIDTKINVTFTISPSVNGTLSIYNITDNEHKASINGGFIEIEIINGVGTLEDVNATDLGIIEFGFTPDNGETRDAEGELKVTTATATPTPSTVYIGEPSIITVVITHPETGQTLSGINVGLISDILESIPDDVKTDDNGAVVFGVVSGGSGDIIIEIEGEFDEDNKFTIKSKSRKTLTISSQLYVNEGEEFIVSVKSNDNLITDVSATIVIEGVGSHTTTTGSVTITAPSVDTDLSYRITGTALGYTTDEIIVLVKNLPKLNIILSKNEIKGKEKFTVTVSDDKGSAIIGSTVLFNGKTYTTGVGGSIELTAPNEVKQYTIETYRNGYQGNTATLEVTKKADENGSPGFELLTLVAALGIALILLRKRK